MFNLHEMNTFFRLAFPSCKFLVQRNFSSANRVTPIAAMCGKSTQPAIFSFVAHKPILYSSSLSNISVPQFRYFSSAFLKQDGASSISSDKKSQNIQVNEEDDEEDDVLYRTIQIEARSADRQVLNSYEKFVTMSANYLEINLIRVWEPFRTIKRRTLLRSAFVKKKYRVQYEWRTYYRNMEFRNLTGSTAETFLEYIERNLPEGVALKVTRERIEPIPSHLVSPQNISQMDQQKQQ